MSQTLVLSRSAPAMPRCWCSRTGCSNSVWCWVMLAGQACARACSQSLVLEMAQQQGEFWHSFMTSPKPGLFSPKKQKRGRKELLPHIPDGGEDVDLVFHKHRAEPCVFWALLAPERVLPPESWLGRAAGQHPHLGLGGDLLSFPSQQREKRFFELLTALRA